jgi:hypothetical protein
MGSDLGGRVVGVAQVGDAGADLPVEGGPLGVLGAGQVGEAGEEEMGLDAEEAAGGLVERYVWPNRPAQPA